MYSVTFNALIVKNFLSVGEVPVRIDFQAGINVITGVNRDKEDSKNGVGKSTIIDALHFAFFGTTIRELCKDYIVNSQNKKNCEVTLEFQVIKEQICESFRIIRTLNPSKCSIFKNDEDATRSTIAKTNEYIQSIIRSSASVFQNSVVMTANGSMSFMAQSKIEKRKFIENILNLEIFSKMLSLTRERYNDSKKEYEIVFAKQKSLLENVTSNSAQLNFFEQSKHKRIDELNVRIMSHEKSITQLRSQSKCVPDEVFSLIESKIKALIVTKQSNDGEYIQVKVQVDKIKDKITTLKQQLIDIKKVGAICTTCSRPYDESDTKHRESAANQLDEQINILTLEFNKTINQLKDIVQKRDTIQSNIDTYNNKKSELITVKENSLKVVEKIDYINETVIQYTTDIEKIKLETNTQLLKRITDTEKELESAELNVKKINTDLQVLEDVKFIVSEEGVKTYIVKKILKLLNSRITYYLNALQANCICTFNEFFEDVIICENGTERSYFNFSGGERKRIDLACLFAFLDIRRLQGDVNFSTIFYDELLDSALDDVGIELVLNVLRERCELYKEYCYIITHRGTSYTGKIDNIITLEKRNGYTYILQ
jgi:DNA repair exonuclease SbcCD ATPase subunit